MIGPKEKKERSLGEKLGFKAERSAGPKSAFLRKPYRPGQHGQSRQRALSDFGRQIKEKQKFKLTYGLDERNLRRLFEKALKKTGSTANHILELLEGRLDNVVFRLGFAPSRLTARQMVVHGHIRVNGKKVRSPGYEVEVGDIVSVRPESMGKASFKNLKEVLKKLEIPGWLSVDPDKIEGRVLSKPQDFKIPYEINLLVESFSK